MFEFIKNLFRKKDTSDNPASRCPFLVHADISESIVIKEVALEEVKPKPRKPKAPKLKEVKPAVAKGVKPAKEKPVDNIVTLVQPNVETPAKPKKPAKPKRVVIEETFSILPPKPKGRPKKDKTS